LQKKAAYSWDDKNYSRTAQQIIVMEANNYLATGYPLELNSDGTFAGAT